MSDPRVAISLSGVGKCYRLYPTPRDKALDALGLGRVLPWWQPVYDTFWALRGVDLSVQKGERVGILGRNGAGKSTLLKIVSGNLVPSEGKVRVRGRVQALMELGTGFHPEFTGDENVQATLAYQGIPDAEIPALIGEILDFAELGEFAGQPFRTYSAGMQARLAFAAATAVRPEILIIDEILSVGDAYFSAKAFERMRDLTSGGTTVVFVSHDLSSVQRMCDRCLWIECGRVEMDGEALEVVKHYHDFSQRLEEQRIRARNLGVLQSTLSSLNRLTLFSMASSEADSLSEDVWVSRIVLEDERGRVVDEVAVGRAGDAAPGTEGGYVVAEGMRSGWSRPEDICGRPARALTLSAGEFAGRRAAFLLNSRGITRGRLRISYRGHPQGRVLVERYDEDDDGYRPLGSLEKGNCPGWSEAVLPCEFQVNNRRSAERSKPVDVSGGDTISFESVWFEDAEGGQRSVFPEGSTISLCARFEVRKAITDRPYFGYVMFEHQGVIVDNQWFRTDVCTPGSYELCVRLKGSPRLKRGRYLYTLAFYEYADELVAQGEQWSYYVRLDRKVEMTIDSRRASGISRGVVDLEPKLEIRRERSE